ncbi:MAG TPA: serine/threonine-protein kinase [Myxococcaceae bacterium]|nr:serine/threonine-protein kinase [Myxococcaceae bacterium]
MASCQHCGRDHGAPTPPVCPVTTEPMNAPGLIGARLDRYAVQSLLGSGGFGAVYVARHVHTESLVALKVLKRFLSHDPVMLDRLLREAKAAASVGSEHIVRVLDAGVSPEGQAFLAMELLEGMDLKDVCYREPMTPVRLASMVVQVLDALEVAHAKGIVHRDLKPANIFVTAGDFVKLLDFGISKVRQEGAVNALTQTGMAMGTPAYMAPEQFFSAKDVDGRADLYSVGVILYELLAGRLPFDAQSYADLLVQIRTQPPPPLLAVAPQTPQVLAEVVDQALERDPARRFGNAAAMARALRSAVGLPPRAQSAPAARPLSDASMMGDTATPRPTPGGPPPPQPLAQGSMMGATAPPRNTPMTPRAPPPPPPPPMGPAPVVGAAAPVLQATPLPQVVQRQPIQALPTPAPAPAANPGRITWTGPRVILAIIGALFAMCVMGSVCSFAFHQ